MYKTITLNLIILINLFFSSILAQNDNFESPEITLNSNVSQFFYSEDGSTSIYYGDENIIHFINNEGQEVRSIHDVNIYGEIRHGIEKGGVFYFLTMNNYLMKIDFGLEQYSEVNVFEYRDVILKPELEKGGDPFGFLVSLNNDPEIYLRYDVGYGLGHAIYKINPKTSNITNLTTDFPPFFRDEIYDNIATIRDVDFNKDEIIFTVVSAPSFADDDPDATWRTSYYSKDISYSMHKIKNGKLETPIHIPEELGNHSINIAGFSLNGAEITWHCSYSFEGERTVNGEDYDYGSFNLKNNEITNFLNNEYSDFRPDNYSYNSDDNFILKRIDYNNKSYFINDDAKEIFTLDNSVVSFPFNVVSMTPIESKGEFGPLLFLGKKTGKIKNNYKYDNETILYELYGDIWFESGIGYSGANCTPHSGLN
jgi:hypothetical protein